MRSAKKKQERGWGALHGVERVLVLKGVIREDVPKKI